ncbi:vesicular integral-membrane protein VIP36 isoform X2 [Hyposmocoma kahamanoa]|uniref:vesicular integral-membrane protein VIP36 isoform X2 n=1 Tax=Hyposmocoma kahamanoa TaxID=1477025 RepID=UPI000E6D82D2|nr:vesicular integral-membrane protein VIP36 isoform X2 [Hyposmocoma kahamanoa]
MFSEIYKWFTILCIYIFVIPILAEWNTRDYIRREHSLTKPYQGSGMSVPYWDFLGSTIVTSNYVRLTPDSQSKSGALWNTVPCYTRNWELQVQFKVHGKGKELFGDGLALWYVRDRMQGGPVFGSKDYFHGLAIILDTYSNHNGAHNHQHPYISAMINNGSLHYDHDRDGTHTQIAGCEAKFRNYNHDTHLSIVYKDDTLIVSTDLEGKNAWKECLRVSNVLLPTGYFFGASATTGDLSDNHDIIAIKMYELDLLDTDKNEDRSNIIPSAASFEAPRERVEDPKPAMSGVKTFLWMMFYALVIIVLVVLGIWWYQKRQENSRKRLY